MSGGRRLVNAEIAPYFISSKAARADIPCPFLMVKKPEQPAIHR
jgi:hypothetical protein